MPPFLPPPALVVPAESSVGQGGLNLVGLCRVVTSVTRLVHPIVQERNGYARLRDAGRCCPPPLEKANRCTSKTSVTFRTDRNQEIGPTVFFPLLLIKQMLVVHFSE